MIFLIASSRSTVTESLLSDPAFSQVVAETVCGPVNLKSPDTVGLFPIIALKSVIRFFAGYRPTLETTRANDRRKTTCCKRKIENPATTWQRRHNTHSLHAARNSPWRSKVFPHACGQRCGFPCRASHTSRHRPEAPARVKPRQVKDKLRVSSLGNSIPLVESTAIHVRCSGPRPAPRSKASAPMTRPRPPE
jgi:hypothetical protein